MAIIEFTFKKENIPADAVDVREGKTGDRTYWTWLTYVGLCLRDYERNGYDDSDFFMVVWNPEKGETEDICFASTRGWTYPAYGSFADATPETLAAYEAYEEKRRQQQAVWDAENAEKQRLAKLAEPAKGKMVEVFKGRKVPVGTVGQCFWKGQVGGNWGAERIGIKTASGEVFWTAATNARAIQENK